MHARPIQVRTKVHFKILQFFVVMYDTGFLRCAIEFTNHCQRLYFQDSGLMFCIALKDKVE